MRKVLLAAFLIVVAGASQVGAEGCYVDPNTGIENCSNGSSGPCFDPNGDGVIDSADFFYLVNFIYEDGPPPIGNGDANGDGDVDFADIVYLYNFLFLGGPAPVC